MFSFAENALVEGVRKGMEKVPYCGEPVSQVDLLLRMSELLERARSRSMRPSAIQETEKRFSVLDGYRFHLSAGRYFTTVPAAK